MSLQKKNVLQGFIQDDIVPTGQQQIVRYISGKGNNLHEVESPEKSTFLVSMPKKYRQTVWLKKGDCIVIDPIAEGNKVRGEIIGLLTSKTVLTLIRSLQWPPKQEQEGECSSQKLSDLVDFFGKGKHPDCTPQEDSGFPWPSSEDDSGSEESEEEPEDDEDDSEDGGSQGGV